MLHELHVTGLGVIDDLDLEPHAGLTVLTGETGAGKTMVTVAVGLATGVRASAQLVRPGASAAKVQARFDAPPDAGEWAEDGQVILARTVGADGRGGARISGQLTTVGALATIGASLVEVHAQHHSLRLLDPAVQTAMLDRAAGPEHVEAVAAMRLAHAAWNETERRLHDVRATTRDREQQIDLLRYQVAEIEAVSPVASETEVLTNEAARLGHVERLIELAGDALGALDVDGPGHDAVTRATGSLAAAAELDPQTGHLAARAASLAAELGELTRDVRAYADALWADPERLALVRERLGQLKALQRKYGDDDVGVIAFLADALVRLDALTGDGDDAELLAAEAARLRARFLESAAQVSDGRARTAPDLAEVLTAEIRDLGMPSAALRVSLEVCEPAATGAERVVLELAPAREQGFLPVAGAASGGELSRVMLACRSVLAGLDDVPTLVFDEVDAGIGGQAGLAVGSRLARLAASRQVIVVTHLPQIACFADRHVRVRKQGGTAVIEVLDGAERRLELARMLAGLEDSAHGASHADELLTIARELRGEHAASDPSGSSIDLTDEPSSSATVGSRG